MRMSRRQKYRVALSVFLSTLLLNVGLVDAFGFGGLGGGGGGGCGGGGGGGSW